MGQPTGDNSTTTSHDGSTTGTTGTTEPTNTPAGQPNTSPNPNADQTFTQADVDRIVADRLNREKAKYSDYDQLKTRAGQWDKFVEESQTDQQKALSEATKTAEQAAYTKARDEFGGRLVEAHIRASAAGRMSEGALAALLGGVSKTVFLTESGDVDQTKITSFIDGIAPTTPTTPTGPTGPPGGFGQGPRDSQPTHGIQAGIAAFAERHKEGQAPPMFR